MYRGILAGAVATMAMATMLSLAPVAAQQTPKPNIILIVSDDTGYGDLGPYGGGEGRGMPTPNIDRMANEGMTFFSFYAQPSCTPGRAAMQTGRIPNRSGMTTVAFQGQGGGLPAAEWTLASVLKTGGYKTFFTGKWHLGEADYALPNAQGYDEMKYVGLYHLNAYTYADPTWFPDMDPELRAMFAKVTKGADVGQCRARQAQEDFKINGQYVDTPVTTARKVCRHSVLRRLRREGAARVSGQATRKSDKPFFMSINFMKVHQPNMPHPDYIHKSMSKSKFADSIVELDARIGRIMDKVRALGLDKNTMVFYTTDNGAWQDVYPDAGYTPFRGTKGTVREGGNRVPAIAWMPGKIKADAKNHDIVGGLDLMATFAALARRQAAGQTTAKDKPIIFDSYRHVAGPVRHRQDPREHRGSTSPRTNCRPARCASATTRPSSICAATTAQPTGGLAVDANLGWKGAEKYVATVPQVFDLLAGPAGALRHLHEQLHRAHLDRWSPSAVAIKDLMKTYVKYPPRKRRARAMTVRSRFSNYEKFQWLRNHSERKASVSAANRQLDRRRPRCRSGGRFR